MSPWSTRKKMRRFCLAIFLLCCAFIAVSKSQNLKLPILNAKEKVALVIGNNDYQGWQKLNNPRNDAKLIGDTLRDLGFKVIYRYDQTRDGMEESFKEFSNALRPGSVALFFYAGHGLQVRGVNYLVPIDHTAQKDVDQLWDIGAAINGISGKSSMNIIILDSCRNAPKVILDKLNGEIGFTEFKSTAQGNFVAFSTSPNSTAADGAGGNSPYSTMLAEGLKWKPAQLDQVFMYTQMRVEEITRGKQVPWRNSSTKALFYFTADEVAQSPPVKFVFQSKLRNQILSGLRPYQFYVPVLNERGTILNQQPGTAKYFIENSLPAPLAMIEIQGGRFEMGASAEEVSDALEQAKKFDEFDEETYEVLSAELPQHGVNVQGFYMSRSEITQAQYFAVMGELPPIEPQFRGAEMPVVKVTFTEANEFCARLTKLTGRFYRLPTEAEWEYAARAGTRTPFAFGETINLQVAAYNSAIPYNKAPRGTRRAAPTEVGALNSTNAFGLDDMHGNVWEWCADYWHSDYDGAPVDGTSWDEPQEIDSDDADEEGAIDSSRIARGGSWSSPASRLRSASRYRFAPSVRSSSVGFRVVAQ